MLQNILLLMPLIVSCVYGLNQILVLYELNSSPPRLILVLILIYQRVPEALQWSDRTLTVLII